METVRSIFAATVAAERFVHNVRRLFVLWWDVNIVGVLVEWLCGVMILAGSVACDGLAASRTAVDVLHCVLGNFIGRQ